jgi:hypothetical protein
MKDSTDEKNLKQVDGLWFDGDLVILRAGNHIFRVLTTVLKERSPVFASMFAFPQPPGPESETIGGVPVVNMHDDPSELELFLKAMFDPTYAPLHSLEDSIDSTVVSFQFLLASSCKD